MGDAATRDPGTLANAWVEAAGRACLHLLLGLAAAGIFAAPGLAQEPAWELRFCFESDDGPLASADDGGFDVEIARVLAAELGAEPAFVWRSFERDVVAALRTGACDVMMGVPDGFAGFATTLAYYRGSYVFVTRADGPQVASFDDPALGELRIGVQNVRIPPYQALATRGVAERVVRQYGQVGFEGDGGARELVADVAQGAIDVGIAWGPAVAGFAASSEPALRVVPVAPQIDPPFVPMSFPVTMAVRPGDEALRDALDRALTARWQQVRAVLREAGLPSDDLRAPRAAEPSSDAAAPVGVVLPLPPGGGSAFAAPDDLVARAALRGAVLAEEEVEEQARREGGERVELLVANAPTAEAAARAARMLLAANGAIALVGGVGEDQARVLAALAAERGVPFLNVGSTSTPLRQTASGVVLHLEASARMYLDALIAWHARDGPRRWFVLHPDDQEGAGLRDEAVAAIRACHDGGSVVGSAAVDRAQAYFGAELEELAASGADLVLLLSEPAQQIAVLAQLDAAEASATPAPFPHPATQTRQFMAAAQFRGGRAGSGARVALWEASLQAHGAGELNERYLRRWGEPMDPSAWSGYQAVRVLHRTMVRGGSRAPVAPIDQLAAAAAVDVAKGSGTWFDAETGQLRQPLYVIDVADEPRWGRTAGERLSVASLQERLSSPCAPR